MPTNRWRTTEWKISYSVDGSSFIDVQTYSKDIYRNTEKFLLPKEITCKIFRINGIKSSDNSDDMLFNSFDCYGTVVKRTRNKCSCNYYFYKRRLTIGLLLTLFPSFLT